MRERDRGSRKGKNENMQRVQRLLRATTRLSWSPSLKQHFRICPPSLREVKTLEQKLEEEIKSLKQEEEIEKKFEQEKEEMKQEMKKKEEEHKREKEMKKKFELEMKKKEREREREERERLCALACEALCVSRAEILQRRSTSQKTPLHPFQSRLSSIIRSFPGGWAPWKVREIGRASAQPSMGARRHRLARTVAAATTTVRV